MKVVYQTCCGVDVHKSFLVATIIKTTSGVLPSYQKKRFANVKQNFTSLGNDFFTLYGKQIFTSSGKEFFTRVGKQFFT